MPVPLTQISLEDVRLELLLAPPVSLSECIAFVNKTGIWKKLSDFAGYTVPYCTVSPTNLNFVSLGETKTATVSSNTTWSVSDDANWIIISGQTGSGNDTFNITASENISIYSRTATVTITWSGGTRTIAIFQEGAGGAC